MQKRILLLSNINAQTNGSTQLADLEKSTQGVILYNFSIVLPLSHFQKERANNWTDHPRFSFNAPSRTLAQAPSNISNSLAIVRNRRQEWCQSWFYVLRKAKSIKKTKSATWYCSNSTHNKTRCETLTKISKIDLLHAPKGQVKISQVPDAENWEVDQFDRQENLRSREKLDNQQKTTS